VTVSLRRAGTFEGYIVLVDGTEAGVVEPTGRLGTWRAWRILSPLAVQGLGDANGVRKLPGLFRRRRDAVDAVLESPAGAAT